MSEVKKSEGSHGGHIIGHTKSGHPIYGISQKLAAYTHAHKHAGVQPAAHGAKNAPPNMPRAEISETYHNTMDNHLSKMNVSKWTPKDHESEADRHRKKAKTETDSAMQTTHKHLAQYHSDTASGLRAGGFSSIDEAHSVQKSEGSRGGHIIGHTKSGKPVYGPTAGYAIANAKLDHLHGDNMKGTGKTKDEKNKVLMQNYAERAAHMARHDDFTSQDHRDAQSVHVNARRGAENDGDQSKAHLHQEIANSHFEARHATENVGKSFNQGGYMKKSEGSRGGHVIGHTSSGKPIYSHKAPSDYSNFTAEDHADASWEHGDASQRVGEPTANRHHTMMRKKHLDAVIAAKHKDEKSGKSPSNTAKKLSDATKKSLNQGEAAMANDEYEDLFKSELGTSGEEDKVLITCPHCDEGITKSEVIAKAKGGSTHDVVKDNKQPHHGKMGPNKMDLPRGGKGAKKYDRVNPGMHAKKGEENQELDQVDDDFDPTDDSYADEEVVPQAAVAKGFEGNRLSTWVNTGLDEYVAKSISEQSLGAGALVSIPMDKNKSRQ